MTEPTGVTVFQEDTVGRVKQTTLRGLRDVFYGYDPKGNVTSVRPPSKPVHEFTYTKIDLQED